MQATQGAAQTVFTHRNAQPCSRVFDVEARLQLHEVMAVDTALGEVTCACVPLRLTADGEEIETFKVQFRTIYPIYGLDSQPDMQKVSRKVTQALSVRVSWR